MSAMPKMGGRDPYAEDLEWYERLKNVDENAERDVSDKDAEFMDSVIKQWKKEGPFRLSEAQREWIVDLEDRYL